MSGSFVGDHLRALHPVARWPLNGLRVATRLTSRSFEAMTARRILRNGRQISPGDHNFLHLRRRAAGQDQITTRQSLDLEGIRSSDRRVRRLEMGGTTVACRNDEGRLPRPSISL